MQASALAWEEMLIWSGFLFQFKSRLVPHLQRMLWWKEQQHAGEWEKAAIEKVDPSP